MTSDAHAAARDRMVDRQLVPRGIRDSRVLEAMRKVPRHLLVPEELKDQAYSDSPLPIGSGQTISQPYIVAFMTEQLELSPTDRVLEIGTGSGYQTAVLSQLADHVTTLEVVPGLAERAETALRELGIGNVTCLVGDGNAGCPDHPPFDAILAGTAAPEPPPALLEQLAPGGRLILPVGHHHQTQTLRKYIRGIDGTLMETDLLAVRFVPFVEN